MYATRLQTHTHNNQSSHGNAGTFTTAKSSHRGGWGLKAGTSRKRNNVKRWWVVELGL